MYLSLFVTGGGLREARSVLICTCPRPRTRVVGAFLDGHSALMLVSVRLRHVAGTRWGTRKYLDMERLAEGRATDRFWRARLAILASAILLRTPRPRYQSAFEKTFV